MELAWVLGKSQAVQQMVHHKLAWKFVTRHRNFFGNHEQDKKHDNRRAFSRVWLHVHLGIILSIY